MIGLRIMWNTNSPCGETHLLNVTVVSEYTVSFLLVIRQGMGRR